MGYRFELGQVLGEKAKECVAGRVIYQITFKDVSEQEMNELRRRVASYAADNELNEEDIKGLSSDSLSIESLGYNRIEEKHGFSEFFRHLGNGRRGSIAYFSREREARVELI